MTVLIAGGGIAGLSLALTCHQIGVPFRLFESAREIKPLGLGINLQPNAVRELEELGLADSLPSVGVKTQDFGLYTRFGQEIWTEPRGRSAGYHWPQYSVHRGKFQLLLYQSLLDRAGLDCIETGWQVTNFANLDSAAELQLRSTVDAATRTVSGDVIVGADGIHSTIRHQMQPEEGPPLWGGAVLWRGVSQAPAFLSGASMVMAGHATQRAVVYPISKADVNSGLCTINWIAEQHFPADTAWRKEDWNRQVDIAEFLPRFSDWNFDWLDLPGLIKSAETVYEFPMVDRDPLDRWTQGAVTLMGDAAHPTYPVGSNGASQAIVDARYLGHCFLEHGVNSTALNAYDAHLVPRTRDLVLTNRTAGPDAVMQLIEDRCGGQFDQLADVASTEELVAHADAYKRTAGFAVDILNKQPRLIPEGARCAL